MPVTVVVGGQFGSEGKGKVAYYLAKMQNARVAVRVGGVNSGHTVIGEDGIRYIFRQLPTASLLPEVICVLPAGCYIDLNVLLEEIRLSGLSRSRLVIDPNAMMITVQDCIDENEMIKQSIGSTASGTGSALIRRIRRNGPVLFAKDEPALRDYIKPTVEFMRKQLFHGERILIEGTQGFGLSVLHSQYYPYVTSRDTTAAAFVSEAGLSPMDVDEIVLTIRAFPIRVGGHSGPLPNEIDWDTVTHISGSKEEIKEFTSVTQRLRRVADFHPAVVKKAIEVNKPTTVVLNHLDYVDSQCRHDNLPTNKTSDFIKKVESLIGLSIKYYGFGPASFVSKKECIHV